MAGLAVGSSVEEPAGTAEALLLSGEVATVVAALRAQYAWSYAGDRYGEEANDPLLEEFCVLRRKIFTWRDWRAVEPLEWLAPFFDIIRSPETSGPVTGVALSSLISLLRSPLLRASARGVAEAVSAAADAVAACKFEATFPASDECVLLRILDVLQALVCGPAGRWLSDDALLGAFQACYRIGHYQTERGKPTSELLTHASRRDLGAIVRAVFERVREMPPPAPGKVAEGEGHAVRLHVSPPPSERGVEEEDAEEEEAERRAGEEDEARRRVQEDEAQRQSLNESDPSPASPP
ncbi:hypothetical protein H632_c947p0, partial [Helicosporidium sp. ATCC 50920]